MDDLPELAGDRLFMTRTGNSRPKPPVAVMVKGFGRRSQHERSRCSGGAGARKPPLEETAGRKGSVACEARYGDLMAAVGSRRGLSIAATLLFFGSWRDGGTA